VPFEEQPETVLNTVDQNSGKHMMSGRKEVEILKSRIVRRPTDILTVYHEMFEVSERVLVYKPMYKVKVQNTKTQKTITLIIDAITGKTSSVSKPKAAPKKKKAIKKPILPSSPKTATPKDPVPVHIPKSKKGSKLAK
jgi:hypothetical protein